jgi:catalase
VRGKPEKFAEHYAQATLFFESQTDIEKAHIAAAFRFELSKVAVRAIRERMVSSLVNVSEELAAEVAAGLGMDVPEAMPKAIADAQPPEVTVSPALSLMALPGDVGIRTRQIAVLIENDVHHAALVTLYGALTDAGAVVHFVGPRVGLFVGDDGEKIEANKSMENSPAVLFDALIVPDGIEAIQAIAGNGHGVEFIKDMFSHGKTILALGAGRELLEMAGIGPVMDEDPGILLADRAKASRIASAFIDAVAAHRHPSRVVASDKRFVPAE